jgi:hypothetical protein
VLVIRQIKRVVHKEIWKVLNLDERNTIITKECADAREYTGYVGDVRENVIRDNYARWSVIIPNVMPKLPIERFVIDLKTSLTSCLHRAIRRINTDRTVPNTREVPKHVAVVATDLNDETTH